MSETTERHTIHSYHEPNRKREGSNTGEAERKALRQAIWTGSTMDVCDAAEACHRNWPAVDALGHLAGVSRAVAIEARACGMKLSEREVTPPAKLPEKRGILTRLGRFLCRELE